MRFNRFIYFLGMVFFFSCSGSEVSVDQEKKKSILIGPVLLQQGHLNPIRELIFTKEGRNLLSSDEQKRVNIWDVEIGEVVRSIRGEIGEGDAGNIYAMALSPDNRLLAVSGYPKSWGIRLIDFSKGEMVALLKGEGKDPGHDGVVTSLAFSPNLCCLISGSSDYTARIWDLKKEVTLHILKGHSDIIKTVVYSPNSQLVLTGGDDHSLRLWGARKGKLLSVLQENQGRVAQVAFSPDGKYILAGGEDRILRLWDGKSGEFIKELAHLKKPISSFSFSTEGDKVIVSYSSRSQSLEKNVFAFPSGDWISSFGEHGNVVWATSVSPLGIAATGGENDYAISLWDIQSGKKTKTLKGMGDSIVSVGFSQDGSTLAWGKQQKKEDVFRRGNLEYQLRLWKKQKNDNIFSFSFEEVSVKDGFSRGIDSVEEISIGTPKGKTHSILEVKEEGQVIWGITRKFTQGGDHQSLTLSTDGEKAISGGANGFLSVYEPAEAEKLSDFSGHTGDVLALVPSSDGRWLLSGSSDQTIRLWEMESGELYLTLFHGRDQEWIAFTPEGFFDASPGGAKYLGYHINRGENQMALMLRFSQLYNIFYRPDLVASKLLGREKDLSSVLKKINREKLLSKEIPPKVEILSVPGEGASRESEIKLDLQLTDQGGGFGKTVYRNNGIVVDIDDPPLPPKEGEKTIRLQKKLSLHSGPNEIQVTSRNSKGLIESEPALVTFSREESFSGRPSLYVLGVGISNYRDSDLKQVLGSSDVQVFLTEINRLGKNLFDKIVPLVLLDEQATLNEIEGGLLRFSQRMKPHDNFIMFLSGYALIQDGMYHYLLQDVEVGEVESYAEKTLSASKLQNLLGEFSSQQSILFLDHFLFERDTARKEVILKTAMNRFFRDTGRPTYAFFQSRSGRLQELEGKGIFTYTLIKGMRGEADFQGNRDLRVGIPEITKFISEELPSLYSKEAGDFQIFTHNIRASLFPVALME